MIKSLAACTLVCAAVVFSFAATSRAQVKPGDHISIQNAAAVKDLVSPGTYYAVTRGMGMEIVAPKRVEWPPPYKVATEQYSSQVRLSEDHRTVLGYVAGQPFPLLDTNDPYVATKIMWDSSFRPIATDDADLRFFECQVTQFNPGGDQKLENQAELGHAGAYYEIGRTEVEPMPADPDFKKTDIWFRAGAYPVISPAEGRGSGGIRYRYWDPNRGDDAWAFLNTTRRVRRVNETILSSSPGLTTWDSDHAGRICRQAAGVQLQIPRRAEHARGRAREEFARASVPDRWAEHRVQRRLGDAAYVSHRGDAAAGQDLAGFYNRRPSSISTGSCGSILTSIATIVVASCGRRRFICRPIATGRCPMRRWRSIRSSASSSSRHRASTCRPGR